MVQLTGWQTSPKINLCGPEQNLAFANGRQNLHITRRGPSPAQLAAEQAAAAALLAHSPPITLQVERLLLARSGVLLLTWTDPSGRLARLRQQLHD
eukprot:gene14574-14703_t